MDDKQKWIEEFKEWIETASKEYAMETIDDPENHMDAVEAVAYDFEEGVRAAYEYITGDELD